MSSFAEMVPLSGKNYKSLTKKARSVLTTYPGVLDASLARGWLGDILALWTVCIGLLTVAQISGGVQVGYLSILIPTSIEAFVVLVGLVWLTMLKSRADKSHRAIIREKELDVKEFSFQTLRNATSSYYNVYGDLKVFKANAIALVSVFILMCIYAVSVPVSPNMATDGSPAVIIQYNMGLLENFKNPIRPDDVTGSTGVIFNLLYIILFKSILVTYVFFDGSEAMILEGKFVKIDHAQDVQATEANKSEDAQKKKNIDRPDIKARYATAAAAPGNYLQSTLIQA
jgi:hypothetical protein